MTTVLGCFIILFIADTHVFAQSRKAVIMRKNNRAPKIDGVLNDACWKNAVVLDNFRLFNVDSPAKTQTNAKLSYDNDNLYIAFSCKEKQVDNFVKYESGKKKNASHMDDSVEVFLKPGSKTNYYHIILNTGNIRKDQRNWDSPLRMDNTWRGDIKSSVKIADGKWSAEIAVPWYNFASDIEKKKWTFNLCRNKRVSPQELSSFSFVDGNFHNACNFAVLEAPDIDYRPYGQFKINEVIIDDIKKDKTGYSYVIKGEILNKNHIKKTLQILIEDKDSSGRKIITPVNIMVDKKSEIPFMAKIRISELGTHQIKIRLRDMKTGKNVYLSSFRGVFEYSGQEMQVLRLAGCEPELKVEKKHLSAFLDRNYYTTEREAKIILEFGGLDKNKKYRLKVDGYILENPIRKILDNVDKAELKISLSKIPHGCFKLKVYLIEANKKLLEDATVFLKKWPPLPPSAHEIKINRENISVLKDGKPFFPVGIIAVPPERMEECAKAGFNTVVRWGRVRGLKKRYLKIKDAKKKREFVKQYLDAAQKAGLFVIEWPMMFSGRETCKRVSYESAVQFINSQGVFLFDILKNHPATIAYFSIDEPYFSSADTCRFLYNNFCRLDPYHPVYINFLPGKIFGPDTYDIAGIDHYTMGGEIRNNESEVYKHVRNVVESVSKYRKPVWHIPLAEIFSKSKRLMNGKLQLLQGYLAIIGGAQGIIWFRWSPLLDDNWHGMKQFVKEVNQLTPILTDKTPKQTVAYFDDNMTDTVKVLIKNHDGKSYLICANADAAPVIAAFTLPGGITGKAVCRFENRKINMSGHQFTDKFSGYARHVYELSHPWPENGILELFVKNVKRVAPVKKEINITNGKRNMILNSGFEVEWDSGWPKCWYMGSTGHLPAGLIPGYWGIQNQNVYDGKYSFFMNWRGDNGANRIYQTPIWHMFLPRGDYVFSAYLKASRKNTKVAFAIGYQKRMPEHVLNVGTEWKRYSAIFHIRNYIKGSRCSPKILLLDKGKLWIDNIQLETGSKASEYEGTP